MAHALMLTASSSGRAPVPTGDGSTLLVDDANAVMITVAPNPSSWDPEELALLRGGQRVATPPMSDGTRWVLMGDDRFGTFQARATAAGTPVESPAVRVVPATVSLRATPPAALAPPAGAAPRPRLHLPDAAAPAPAAAAGHAPHRRGLIATSPRGTSALASGASPAGRRRSPTRAPHAPTVSLAGCRSARRCHGRPRQLRPHLPRAPLPRRPEPRTSDRRRADAHPAPVHQWRPSVPAVRSPDTEPPQEVAVP